MANDLHKRYLAKIHALKKQLGLDDDSYRALLLAHGGKNSAKDMTAREKVKVINWMAKCVHGKTVAEAYADRASVFKAIDTLRHDMQRHINYVRKIAERMCGNSDLNNLTVIELGMVLGALREQQQRELKLPQTNEPTA